MTTPDTSAVRAWARSNGYDVADRGRLPADLTDAYLAAQGGKAAPAKKSAAKKAPAKKAPAKKAPVTKAPAKKAAAKTVARTAPKPAPKAAAPVAETAAPASTAATSSPAPAAAADPKPRPVADDRRLVALGEQLSALTARVAELEKTLGGKPGGSNGVSKRFRRSR